MRTNVCHNTIPAGTKAKRASILLMFPLFVFLVFTCPVKRAMLSSFLPVSESASLPKTEGRQIHTLSSAYAPPVCQGMSAVDKAIGPKTFLPSPAGYATAMTVAVPLSSHPRSAGQDLIVDRTIFHPQPLYVRHQSFLI